MSKLEQAVRLEDPVEHSRSTLFKIAGLVGGVVVGAAILFSGPIGWGAAAAAAGAVGTGITVGAIGGSIYNSVMGPRVAGDVATGARTVFVNGLKAGRVEDIVECHDEPIATGVLRIFIEGKLATRATEETRCEGKLKKDACSPDVSYGGPSVRVMAPRYHGEDPKWLFWTDVALSFVPSPRSMVGAIRLTRLARGMNVSWRAIRSANAVVRLSGAAMRMRGVLRGSDLRKRLDRAQLALVVLGDERGAAEVSQILDDYSPMGLLGGPPAERTPYLDEIEGD